MPSTLSDAERELLSRPQPAVMAVVRPDGAPVTVATWYLLQDDDTVLLTLDAGRKRLEWLRADPRLSLTVLADDWYTQVSVQGTVGAPVADEGLAGADRISAHYTGGPYPNRSRPRVLVTMTIEKSASWNLG